MIAYCLDNEIDIKLNNCIDRPESFKFEIKNNILKLIKIGRQKINKEIDISGINLENMKVNDIKKFNKR